MLKKAGAVVRENTGSLAVGIAPVRHTDYVNDGLVVINGVDAVVADANPPKLTPPFSSRRVGAGRG
jgi:hypothetical protein